MDDVATPAGTRLLVAAAALVAFGNLLVNTVLDGIVVELFDAALVTSYAVALPVDPGVAVWLLVAAWLVGSWLLVVLCRSFAADGTEVLRVSDLRREALPATLRTAIVTGVGGTLVLAGLAFGIVPGLLLAAHLLFAPVFVAVDDAGLDTAIVGSWRLAAANRVRAIGLVTIAAALAGVLGGVAATTTLGSPVLEFLLGVVVTAFLGVVGVGVAVDIYRQHGDGGGLRAGTRQRRSAGAL
jgi:hypothetical protein